MALLRGMLICEDSDLRARLESMISDAGNVAVSSTLDHYPESMEVARLIRISRPEIVFLVVDHMARSVEFVTELDINAARTPVIAISKLRDPRALTELMRFGVREFLSTPLNRVKFEDALRRVVSTLLRPEPEQGSNRMYSFLPARGGSGASTLACNVSHQLSQTSGERVLLADFDLCAGLSRYVLKLNTSCSLSDLAEHGTFFNESTWDKCVSRFGDLEVLQGGRLNPRKPLTPYQVRQMVTYALEKYGLVCADVSGNLEAYSLELLRKSGKIYLVSTVEFPSLALAREKLDFLRGLELADRVEVILTLSPGATAPATATVENALGAPVTAVLDYSEKKVREALVEGTLMSPKTGLSRQIRELAKKITARARAA